MKFKHAYLLTKITKFRIELILLYCEEGVHLIYFLHDCCREIFFHFF